jgi:hypothetical protein
LLAVIAAVPLACSIRSSPAAAACITGALPSASVSGVVVSTSIDPNVGVVVVVKTDDGATRQVDFWGRNPTNTLGGTENTVEDAWQGSLPAIGGRYKMTGDFNGAGKSITVSKCAQSPSVEVLSAPPASPPTVGSSGRSDVFGTSRSTAVGLAAGGAAVLVALVLLRRRSQPG